MALLDRAEWYDIARDTNWTPQYVTEDELFPKHRVARWAYRLRCGRVTMSPIK